MFRSTKRSVIIPQSEHARLSAVFARHWGNDEFDKPKLANESFIRGVLTHDRGYPELDTAGIGEVGEEIWLEIVNKALNASEPDIQADLLVRFHLLRLVSYNLTPRRKALAEQIEEEIDEKLVESTLDKEEFLWADRITHFCDNASFYFCFEKETTGEVKVFSKQESNKETTISYKLLPNGNILVSPWPFNEAVIEGELIAYSAKSYPEELEQLSKPFRIRP